MRQETKEQIAARAAKDSYYNAEKLIDLLLGEVEDYKDLKAKYEELLDKYDEESKNFYDYRNQVDNNKQDLLGYLNSGVFEFWRRVIRRRNKKVSGRVIEDGNY